MSALELHDVAEIDELEVDYDTAPGPMDTFDDVEIDRHLARLAHIEAEHARIDALADARVEDVNGWREREHARFAQSEGWTRAMLQAWHEHRLDADPKAKSLSYPSGTLKSRARAAGLDLVDTEAFLRWAETHAPDLIRETVKHAPDKKAAEAYLRAAETETGPVAIDPSTGESVPGVEVRPASRTFTVEVTK